MRVGIIGMGIAGSSHLFDLVSSDHFTVAAVCARRRERAVAAAKRYAVPLAYDDAGEMLASTDLDAVVIATPPDVTPSLARMALDAGLPALIDKPAASTANALDQIRVHSDRSQVAVAYNRRYQQHVHQARDLLTGGALGTVTSADCEWTAPFIERYTAASTYRRQVGWGHGVVLDTASHILDTLTYLGIAPLVVRRTRLATATTGADVAAHIDLRWSPYDVPVSIRIGENAAEEAWRMTFHATHGHLILTRTRLVGRCAGRGLAIAASDLRRPVDDLIDLAECRPGYGATLTEAVAVLATIDQIRVLAAVRRPWLRPRAKALGRLNGSC